MRAVRCVAAFAGGFAVFLLEEALDLRDWLTRYDFEAEKRAQRARMHTQHHYE